MGFLDNKVCNEHAAIYTPRACRPAEGEENTMFTVHKWLIILTYFVLDLLGRSYSGKKIIIYIDIRTANSVPSSIKKKNHKNRPPEEDV